MTHFSTDIADKGTRFFLNFYTDDKDKFLAMQDLARKCIDNAPTADVEEVRHGHWIKEFAWSYGYSDHHKLTCSECGLTFTEDARSVDEYKYCYGCGAKMDLERRSENEG